MKLTKIIGNNWFSVGFYSIFCFWALGLGLWFFSKKFCLGFFLNAVFKPIRFRPFLGLFQKLVLAHFGPSLGTSLGPVRSLLYFGHFWAFLHIHKTFYNLHKTGVTMNKLAGNKKNIFITCFCSTKKISYNLLQSFYYSH